MEKFKKAFRRLQDPRADNARHDLLEVLVIAFAATLCWRRGPLGHGRRSAAPRNGCFDCSFGLSTGSPATTRSAGCFVCSTRRPSRPHSSASWRRSSSSTGLDSAGLWRSTAKPCAGPSSGAGKYAAAHGQRLGGGGASVPGSAQGAWSQRGCRRLGGTRICWISKAALLPPMRCIAIAPLPQRSSSAAATTCWRSRKIRASCLLPSAGALVAAEPAALPSSANHPLTIGANGGAPPLCAIPASLPHSTFPGVVALARITSRRRPQRRPRRAAARALLPSFQIPSRQAVAARRALSLGHRESAALGPRCRLQRGSQSESEWTTLPRTSRFSEGSLSMSYDPTLPQRLCVRKSSALDGTMPSSWVCSVICDSPAHKGEGTGRVLRLRPRFNKPSPRAASARRRSRPRTSCTISARSR